MAQEYQWGILILVNQQRVQRPTLKVPLKNGETTLTSYFCNIRDVFSVGIHALLVIEAWNTFPSC